VVHSQIASARFADCDKIMRLHAQRATIENGFVFLPDEVPWLADYLAEMTAFPGGRHDDQVDSTAQILAWMKRLRTGGEGWIEFYGPPRRAVGVSADSRVQRLKSVRSCRNARCAEGLNSTQSGRKSINPKCGLAESLPLVVPRSGACCNRLGSTCATACTLKAHVAIL
jgi:hypothetical protein